LQHDGHVPDVAKLRLSDTERQLLLDHLVDNRTIEWILRYIGGQLQSNNEPNTTCF
jgi:hypothetical protein